MHQMTWRTKAGYAQTFLACRGFQKCMPRHSWFVCIERPKFDPVCCGFQEACRGFHCSAHLKFSLSARMPWLPGSMSRHPPRGSSSVLVCRGFQLTYCHMKCLNAAVSNSYAAASSWRIIPIFFLTSDLQVTNLPCNLIKVDLKIHEMKKTNKIWKNLNT